MHIVIPWQGSFPHGMALANRFIALAKGLQEQGESVSVLCLMPAARENAPAGLARRGTHSGVAYEYASKDLFRSSSRLMRQLQRFGGLVRALWRVWRRRAAGKLDLVLLPGMASLETSLILLLAHMLHVPVVHERSEHPYLEAEGKGLLRRLERHYYFRFLVRNFRGVIVISTALERMYRPRIGRRARLLVLPASVDLSRFEDGATPGPVEGRYVAWCGSVWGRKDGVMQLVQAFAQIADRHPDVRLVLMAPLDESADCRRTREAIRGSGCADRIVTTGLVSQAEMPRYLRHAVVLTLARPSSVQAEYGFPTKLVEYLASGRPVIVTRVGDIPRYVEDGVNGYLVDPDDVRGFAMKIDHVLDHPDEARIVGDRGLQLARDVFSTGAQGPQLAAFLHSLA